MLYFYILLLAFCLQAIQASIYASFRKNDRSLWNDKRQTYYPRGTVMSLRQRKEDEKLARDKANVLKNIREHERMLYAEREIPYLKLDEHRDKAIGRENFHMDPVLNALRRRNSDDDDDESSSSDSKHMVDEWNEYWLQKKFEALNSTILKGDVVNMAAARPWGVSCGDPNQHDMPWGSCMLPAECDGEYRIYRGDYFCGRTGFVCCSLIVTNYDMYQGLDLSLEGSEFDTDSEEKKAGGKTSKKKAGGAKRKKRRRERTKRLKKIRKSIRKIVKEIQRMLNKQYRNGTTQRKKKTKELKMFIKLMKKQFRKDRQAIVQVHENELLKIDETLQAKLDHITGVNEKYMANDTFRDIVVNGTINKARLNRFLRQHPELAKYFKQRRTGLELKGVDLTPEIIELVPEEDEPDLEQENLENPENLEYDLEYGMLYF